MDKDKDIKWFIYFFIILFVLIGCSKSDKKVPLNPENPISIEIWHYYNGPLKMVFDHMIAEFNETVGAEKGIIVEAFSQGNVDDLERKVMESVNKKIGAEAIPDMFTAYADTAYYIDKLGLLTDLSRYLTPDEISEYIDSYIQEGYFYDKGGLKIFPIAKATEIMMVNKTDWDMFAKATGASTKDLETWEGLAKTAERYYNWTDSLTYKSNDGKAFFGRDAMANYIIVGSKQLGKEIFNISNGEVTLNIDEKIMKKLWDNFYIPYINGYYKAVGKFRSDDVKTGEIIALVGSTSGIGYFPEKVILEDFKEYDIETMVLPLPNFEGTIPHAVQQGAGMVVVKSDKSREYASVEFLKWFTDKERNIKFSIESGYLPVKKESSSIDAIGEYLNKNNEHDITKQLRTLLPVATKQVSSYELYTNKAFKKGTDARMILTRSLIEKSKSDRDKIVNLIENGYSKDEAFKEFITEDNFKQWLTKFKGDLEKIIN